MRLIKNILQFEHQILATLLLILHSLIWIIDHTYLHASLTFVMYGLFLLWQPLLNKDKDIHVLSALAPLVLLGLFNHVYQNEALIFFSLLVSGMIGSRLFSTSTTRPFDLLALSILILEMSIGIVPKTFQQIRLPSEFESYIQIIVLIFILLFFFAPLPDRVHRTRSQIDLMHGILTTTLIFIVLLGGIVINTLYGVDYTDGLLLTVFIVSTLAIGISWFWNPEVGYSGLGVLWNRYAMTIGGPFEVWINTLTTLIEEPYLTANDFLQAACDRLVENEWLNSIQWQFKTISISSGEKKGPAITHNLSEKLNVTIYFKSNPGQALRQHTILLIRMAYQFYLAKVNQEKMRAEEHFETIHHTGARLTHDMKNILQSIKASLDIVNLHPKYDQPQPQKLLQQNLNQISSRLESTLAKLKSPELTTTIKYQTVTEWITSFKQEHALPKIIYQIEISKDHAIPPDLFDSVVNNLLSNALNKEDVTEVVVDLISNGEMVIVTICDNGGNIQPELEIQLFNKPVSSGQGMGIGLYQSAFMARAFNFELELVNNRNGKVCFSLFQHYGE